jgi:hypothetical protein
MPVSGGVTCYRATGEIVPGQAYAELLLEAPSLLTVIAEEEITGFRFHRRFR